jgi:RNA polymerase sigma factor (sigma-70 family)
MDVNSVDFAKAYERNFPRTVRALSAKGLREDLAHEFAQGAWARAWERRHQLRQPSRLVDWVISIAINSYRSSLRHGKHEEQLNDIEHCYNSGVLPALLMQDLLKGTKRYRRLLEYFYFWGYSADQIAEAYHTSPLAIRVRLSRARAQLRDASSARQCEKSSGRRACT